MRGMRVEPHGVGSIIHAIKRGARGTDIVRDDRDRERFVRSLFYLNDAYNDFRAYREIAEYVPPTRPHSWPERSPLVRILGWTLLSNHFHLILQEIVEGGTAKFMQRLCGSMSVHFNRRYREQGSLFQGGYRGVVVEGQPHLQYLAFYILVKNTLDMFPGGLMSAYRDFDTAWRWAMRYPYSSLHDRIEGIGSPILDDPDELICGITGDSAVAYKQEARELLEFHIQTKGEGFAHQMLESW